MGTPQEALDGMLAQIQQVAMARLQRDAAAQGGKFTAREREMLLAGVTAGAMLTFEAVAQLRAVPSAHDDGETTIGAAGGEQSADSGPESGPDHA